MIEPESVPEQPVEDISKQKTLELGEYGESPNRNLEDAFDSVATPTAAPTQVVPGI